MRRLLIAFLALAVMSCRRDAPTPAPAPSSTSSDVAPGVGPGRAGGVSYLEKLTGGAGAEEAVPVIVAIHGLGDRPDRFAGIVDGLGVKARVILPYGDPYGDGYSWFPAGSLGDEAKLAAGTRAAADRLAGMIEALAKSRPMKGRAIVTGFSQGGMLSFSLAVLHPRLVAAAFPVGGLLPEGFLPAAWPAGEPRPPIVAFHGDADRRVPFERGRAAVEALQRLGFSARLEAYPGVAHTVSARERQDLCAALEDAARREATK